MCLVSLNILLNTGFLRNPQFCRRYIYIYQLTYTSKTQILQFCGTAYNSCKIWEKCKVWKTLFSRAFSRNPTKSTLNHRKCRTQECEVRVLLYRVIHKSVKHFKNLQQINYSTDHGSSYADRERNSPSFFFPYFTDAQCVHLW